jgi:NADH-quinone oxidoreductase subunit C
MTDVALGPVAGVPYLPGIGGDQVLFPDLASYHSTLAALKDAAFEMCVDLCGVDYLGHPGRTLAEGIEPERFEIVVNLLSLSARRRARVRVQVPESTPRVDSIFDLYPGVEAMEREAFDLIGIRFTGHPDLARILMPEEWEGHPLRKDYGTGRVPVQFKEAPGPR